MNSSFSGAEEVDFWTDVRTPADTAHKNAPRLIFTAIPDVAPIDRARSSFDQPDVPEALAPALFSRNGNAAVAIKEGALKTFAVIDGERLCNLPELLEATGLEHISLYGEDADPRLIRSGPWLVKLSEDSRFMRNFFLPDFERNRDNALWLKNWGIFLRSRAGLDDVVRHLRKFTRIRDEYDSWFYFRFWDADFMGLYLRQERAADFPLARRLLDPVIVDSIVVTSPFDGCYTVHLEDVDAAKRVRPAIGFRRDDFDAVADHLADCRAARVFDRNYHRLLRGEALTRLRDRISTARAACKDLGIREDELPGTFILLGVVFARDFWQQGAFMDYWSSSRLAPAERFRLYLSGVKSSMRRAGLPLKAWW
ncbi:MAG: DUF4123 domain-containing protein [Paracoccus sp. (in: a-proteobacteria)]|nr:DUF4123 domain-containing protein [Paracoccus sp. (in: a-proteobacteria)]